MTNMLRDLRSALRSGSSSPSRSATAMPRPRRRRPASSCCWSWARSRSRSTMPSRCRKVVVTASADESRSVSTYRRPDTSAGRSVSGATLQRHRVPGAPCRRIDQLVRRAALRRSAVSSARNPDAAAASSNWRAYTWMSPNRSSSISVDGAEQRDCGRRARSPVSEAETRYGAETTPAQHRGRPPTEIQ